MRETQERGRLPHFVMLALSTLPIPDPVVLAQSLPAWTPMPFAAWQGQGSEALGLGL